MAGRPGGATETIRERVVGLCGVEATGAYREPVYCALEERAREPGAPWQGAPGRRHQALLGGIAGDCVSARVMLRALVPGERDPDALAELARGTLRRQIPALREALAGRFRDG